MAIRPKPYFLLPVIFIIFMFFSFEVSHAEYMTVKVRVIDDNSAPLPYATILMFQGGCYVASNHTNANGVATFSYVDPEFNVRFLVYYKGIEVGDFCFDKPPSYVVLKCRVSITESKCQNQKEFYLNNQIRKLNLLLKFSYFYPIYQSLEHSPVL